MAWQKLQSLVSLLQEILTPESADLNLGWAAPFWLQPMLLVRGTMQLHQNLVLTVHEMPISVSSMKRYHHAKESVRITSRVTALDRW